MARAANCEKFPLVEKRRKNLEPDNDNGLFNEIINDVITDANRLFQMAQQVSPSYGAHQTSSQIYGKLELLEYQSNMLNQRIRLARQSYRG